MLKKVGKALLLGVVFVLAIVFCPAGFPVGGDDVNQNNKEKEEKS